MNMGIIIEGLWQILNISIVIGVFVLMSFFLVILIKAFRTYVKTKL